MIEHMSEEFIELAQYTIMFWPVWLVVATLLILRAIGRRRKNQGLILRRGLLVTWLMLLPAWVLAWFGAQPAPKLLPEPLNSLLFLSGLAGLILVELAPILTNLDAIFGLSIIQRLHQIRAIEELNSLTPTQFEELVQEVYRRLGYRVRHVGHSGDHGVDLVIHTRSGEHWVVQCKRWRDPVGEGTVRELYGTLHHERAERAILVTSAEITPPAREWARGKPIDLIDGPALLGLIARSHRSTRPSLWRRLANWLPPRPKIFQPPPTCPACQQTMILRPARSTDPDDRETYRCNNYPTCRVVIVRHQ